MKSSLAAQAVLRRVENERDDALANVHSITVERDTLHERLKVHLLSYLRRSKTFYGFILALVRAIATELIFRLAALAKTHPQMF